MVCTVLEQVTNCFRAAISQKLQFIAQKWPKNAILFGVKEFFWGLSGELQGPIPYFEGAGLKTNVFCRVLEQVIKCFRAVITKKAAFCLAKMAERYHFLA